MYEIIFYIESAAAIPFKNVTFISRNYSNVPIFYTTVHLVSEG